MKVVKISLQSFNWESGPHEGLTKEIFTPELLLIEIVVKPMLVVSYIAV